MHILYLADIRFPLERANGIQTMETAYALVARGHVVSLGVRPDIVRPARDPFLFYGCHPSARFTVERTPAAGPQLVRRVTYLTSAAARAVRRPRRVDVVYTRDLGVADALVRIPPRWRPPVVYESHGYAPVFADTLPELVPGARRGSPRKLRRLERREHRVWRRAEGYVTTTQVLAAELTQRFGPRPHLLTASNGSHLSPARTGAARPPAEPPVVAYAGHLYPWKGSEVMVRALASVPASRGMIVGGREGDADFGRVGALVRELGLRDRITLTGPVPRADVPAMLAAADVLVLPTLATESARYTSPLKLFEYMASGTPIVASDLAPIREILTDDKDARLVPPADPDALASALRALLANPSDATRLARAAFERVGAHSWACRAERIERLLDDLQT